ncbi:MAG: hypothetical protein ACOCZH_02035 [Phototrophicaceae bacterium]
MLDYKCRFLFVNKRLNSPNYPVIHLWDALNFVKTRGKIYRYVEEDGIVFAFDILAAYHQVRRDAAFSR